MRDVCENKLLFDFFDRKTGRVGQEDRLFRQEDMKT